MQRWCCLYITNTSNDEREHSYENWNYFILYALISQKSVGIKIHSLPNVWLVVWTDGWCVSVCWEAREWASMWKRGRKNEINELHECGYIHIYIYIYVCVRVENRHFFIWNIVQSAYNNTWTQSKHWRIQVYNVHAYMLLVLLLLPQTVAFVAVTRNPRLLRRRVYAFVWHMIRSRCVIMRTHASSYVFILFG